ncbi:hypothetical protein VYU27_005642 [Nannochloropsis oceanica]
MMIKRKKKKKKKKRKEKKGEEEEGEEGDEEGVEGEGEEEEEAVEAEEEGGKEEVEEKGEEEEGKGEDGAEAVEAEEEEAEAEEEENAEEDEAEEEEEVMGGPSEDCVGVTPVNSSCPWTAQRRTSAGFLALFPLEGPPRPAPDAVDAGLTLLATTMPLATTSKMLTGASQKVGLQCQSLLNGILFDSERAAGATATMVMTGGGGKGGEEVSFSR